MNSRNILSLLVAALLGVIPAASARMNVKAVLVELKSEKNRMDAFKAAHNNSLIAILNRDIAGADSAMINDFTDNFHFCPVYYFVDTNEDAVKAHKYGCLLKGDMTPVEGNPMADVDTEFIVVYYGKYAYQSRTESVAHDSTSSTVGSGLPYGKGLVILNHKMQQISYLYKLDYDNLVLKATSKKKYYYTSKKFQLEYFPFAIKLNQALIDNSNKIRISR